MALVLTQSGQILLLSYAFKDAAPESLVLKLYKNDVTPTESSTAATFTEADFTGYSSRTLSRSTWGTPTTVDGQGVISYGAPLTWTCGTTTQNTIFGYFVVGATSGSLVYAERFAQSRTLVDGDPVQLTPTFTLDNAP